MKIGKPLLLLAAAIGLMATSASAEEARRIAFLIGANDGGSGRVRLRYAESDARAFSNVLETLGHVTPGDRFLLLNPSREEVIDGLARVRETLLRKSGPRRTELFVYYSGHSDEDGLMLGEERFSYAQFRDTVESLPADVRVVILDSCASGAMTRLKGGVWKAPFDIDEATKVEGHAILTSSAANEAAQESDRIGGSFFTHYLISGLRGAADASHDGRVTLIEAYNFASNETLARTQQTSSGPQHAMYDFKLSGSGDLVITDLRGSSARLVLPQDIDGRLFVRDSDGHLAAELKKAAGREMELGLDPGTYTITLIQQDNEALGSTVTLSDGRRSELVLRQMERLSKEVAVARGGPFIDPPLSAEETHYINEPFSASILPGFSSTAAIQGRVATNVSFNLPFGHVDRVQGVQIGVLNRTTDDVSGVDLALGGSWISHNLYGVQLSGLFNIAGSVTGLQIASIFNSASTLRGAQIGLVNFGGEVRGAQIGAINVGSNVRGLQLGLVNIADEMDGVPIGLFSYSRYSSLHLDIWTSDSAPINIGVKAGGKYFYTLLALAPIDQGFFDKTVTTQTHAFGSFGVGVRYPFKWFYIATDFSGGPEFRTVPLTLPGSEQSVAVYSGSNQVSFERDFSGLFKLRGMIGWQPYEHFGIFAGIGANAYITPVDTVQPGTPAGWGPHIFFENNWRSVTIWPGGFFGIQL